MLLIYSRQKILIGYYFFGPKTYGIQNVIEIRLIYIRVISIHSK